MNMKDKNNLLTLIEDFGKLSSDSVVTKHDTEEYKNILKKYGETYKEIKEIIYSL